jgi:predicted metal-dependent phosphoesterase TrpH
MKADLHIHSNCSDGKFTVEEIFQEAKARGITCLSITDHDSIKGQSLAIASAKAASIRYITGVELNVTFSHPDFKEGKTVSLDFLGYNFDPTNSALNQKLDLMVNCRQERAAKILSKLNAEFTKEALPILTAADFEAIHSSVDGALGRPHIADYLVKKGIVKSSQEAFDKYLVKCDVPKYPLYLKEASQLIRGANGKIVLAHPNDPHGISLQALTTSLEEQTQLVDASMLY